MKIKSQKILSYNYLPECSQMKLKIFNKEKMVKDISVKIFYVQMFDFEWICCFNKGHVCSAILKVPRFHIFRCQVCKNQNDIQTMEKKLQKAILFSLVWMVSSKSPLVLKSMKNQDANLDIRQTLKSSLTHLHCIALKIQLLAK